MTGGSAGTIRRSPSPGRSPRTVPSCRTRTSAIRCSPTCRPSSATKRAEPMKLLVTGGAGFIGSAVIRLVLRETAAAVVNLDKLTYAANLDSLAAIEPDPRYAFEKVDICDRPEVERVFRQHRPDAVMHLAAESHVDRSIDAPASFLQTNVVGSCTLLEVALDYWRGLP